MAIDPKLRTPVGGAKKQYLSGTHYPDLKIPYREITLTNDTTFSAYDTSGPYTDERVAVDVCLLYTSPSPRDGLLSRMPSSS